MKQLNSADINNTPEQQLKEVFDNERAPQLSDNVSIPATSAPISRDLRDLHSSQNPHN